MEKNQKPTPKNVDQPDTQAELTPDQKPLGENQKMSIQQRFGQAAQEGVERARKMTHSQILTQARRNSGYVAKAIHLLPKPGTRVSSGIKKPTTTMPPSP